MSQPAGNLPGWISKYFSVHERHNNKRQPLRHPKQFHLPEGEVAAHAAVNRTRLYFRQPGLGDKTPIRSNRKMI
jgi:hypothetical protein